VINTTTHNDTEAPTSASELKNSKLLKSPDEMAAQVDLSKRTFLTYFRKGLVSGIRLSARCYRFDPDRVMADLSKLSTGAGI